MNIKYRPDIDGLRAISIIAVIFYHAPIKKLNDIFGGGYIGVDIFFVISGYLITSIIYKELIETGNFSFKNFYERRVRRIIPPLVFVCFITLPIAWYYLLPFSIIELSKSIIYSLESDVFDRLKNEIQILGKKAEVIDYEIKRKVIKLWKKHSDKR